MPETKGRAIEEIVKTLNGKYMVEEEGNMQDEHDTSDWSSEEAKDENPLKEYTINWTRCAILIFKEKVSV